MTLGGYAEQLWPLTRELEGCFETWLPRLRALFGSRSQRRKRAQLGEPDGFSGLSRRGGWDRLVLSEWALAQELPAEFVRRAAMGEQLFLEVARVEPTESPVTRVWFDAGPDQLGAPRLAHLALLVVLHRRALEAGGRLVWSTLHRPSVEHEDIDPVGFLRERTFERNTPDLRGTDERLVVGPACEGADRIVVEEGPGCLRVSWRGSTVELDLPVAVKVAAMLRHPRSWARDGQDDTIHGIAFNHSGGALLVHAGHIVGAFAVPEDRRQRVQVRARHAHEGELIAVGWWRQRLMTLRRTANALVLHGRSASRHMPLPDELQLEVGMNPMFVLPASENGPSKKERTAVLLRDDAGLVRVLDFDIQGMFTLGPSRTDIFEVDQRYGWFTEDTRQMLVPGLPGRDSQPVLRDYGERQERVEPALARRVVCWSHRWFECVLTDDGWRVSTLFRRGEPVTVDARDLWPCSPDGERIVVYTQRGDLVQRFGRVNVLHHEGLAHLALGGRNIPVLATVDVGGGCRFSRTDGTLLNSFSLGEHL